MSLAEAGYEDVATFGDSGGYDWTEMHVYSKDGRLFALHASGCSCSSFEDDERYSSEADLTELPTLASARSYHKDVFGNDQYADDAATVTERFRELGLR